MMIVESCSCILTRLAENVALILAKPFAKFFVTFFATQASSLAQPCTATYS
jgi:hypothetical protein